jgi:hypothetical protein
MRFITTIELQVKSLAVIDWNSPPAHTVFIRPIETLHMFLGCIENGQLSNNFQRLSAVLVEVE